MNPRDHENALASVVRWLQQEPGDWEFEAEPHVREVVDRYLSYMWGKGYKLVERGHEQS